jgi:hypothetical protein
MGLADNAAYEQRTANLIALMHTPEFTDIDGTWSITMKFRQELLQQITERLGLE